MSIRISENSRSLGAEESVWPWKSNYWLILTFDEKSHLNKCHKWIINGDVGVTFGNWHCLRSVRWIEIQIVCKSTTKHWNWIQPCISHSFLSLALKCRHWILQDFVVYSRFYCQHVKYWWPLSLEKQKIFRETSLDYREYEMVITVIC